VETRYSANRNYWIPFLRDDVASATDGRIIALVRALPDVPQVIRFGSDREAKNSSDVVVKGLGAKKAAAAPPPWACRCTSTVHRVPDRLGRYRRPVLSRKRTNSAR
jgi:hypothetical protein